MAETKIPKIIHFCWFGHGEYSDKMKYCMASWEKYCPDYKIMKWDEDSFDLDSCNYIRQAYDKKRWAFVTDYVRFKVLQQYGGVYLDTDMEVIKPFNDLLNDDAVLSFKQVVEGTNFNGLTSAFIATKPNNPDFNPLIEQFESRSYINEEGEEDITPIAKFLTDLVKDKGIKLDDSLQSQNGITVYPHEYLCPTVISTKDSKIATTDNTHVIHHFVGTWRTPEIMEVINEKIRNAKEGETVV